MIRKFILMFVLFFVAAGVTGSARAANEHTAMAIACALATTSTATAHASRITWPSTAVVPRAGPQIFPSGNGYICIPETWPGGGKYQG